MERYKLDLVRYPDGITHYNPESLIPKIMNVQIILPILTIPFVIGVLFFGTRNGFYNSDKYHGNGSAH
jgi:hypothetical protein